MKDQYVGDIGDFGKYALLRAFANAGIKVGVNWYKTVDDDSNDGKFTEYLKSDELRWRDPEVFDALKVIAFKTDKCIEDVEKSGIIPSALFYSELLNPIGTPSDREQERNLWFQESIFELAGAELVFMDPDNGLLIDNDPCKRGAEKYVLPDEVEQYYNAGHNVVYYCHKGRRKIRDWHEYKSYMCKILPDAKAFVLTYHKGTQRSFIFLIHPEDFKKYNKVVQSFMYDNWHKIFSEEYTENGDPAKEQIGERFTIECLHGRLMFFCCLMGHWI